MKLTDAEAREIEEGIPNLRGPILITWIRRLLEDRRERIAKVNLQSESSRTEKRGPMPQTITFQMDHTSLPPGRVEGFRYLWAFYVNGYRPEKHCQPCFLGRRVDQFCTPTARSGALVSFDLMDQYPFVYVCGVGVGPKAVLRDQNLHFPMRYREGGLVEATTYNGYTAVAHNAELVDIPVLPRGWNDLSDEHVGCKNFRFAVGAFGWPGSADKSANPLATPRPDGITEMR